MFLVCVRSHQLGLDFRKFFLSFSMISDKTQDIFEVVISGLLGFAHEYQKAEVKMTPKNYIVDSLHSMAHAL